MIIEALETINKLLTTFGFEIGLNKSVKMSHVSENVNLRHVLHVSDTYAHTNEAMSINRSAFRSHINFDEKLL